MNIYTSNPLQYYYRIRHRETGIYYIGIQHGAKADPTLFFKKYFTSSSTVKRLIEESGLDIFEIRKVVIVKDARAYETRILNYWLAKLGKERFIATFYNRTTNPAILMTDDIKKNMSEAQRGKKRSAESIQKRSEARKGKVRSVETRKKISEAQKGKAKSAETRRNMSEAKKGKKQSAGHRQNGAESRRGTKWWNNNLITKRAHEWPGDGWVLGRLPR